MYKVYIILKQLTKSKFDCLGPTRSEAGPCALRPALEIVGLKAGSYRSLEAV